MGPLSHARARVPLGQVWSCACRGKRKFRHGRLAQASILPPLVLVRVRRPLAFLFPCPVRVARYGLGVLVVSLFPLLLRSPPRVPAG